MTDLLQWLFVSPGILGYVLLIPAALGFMYLFGAVGGAAGFGSPRYPGDN